MKDLNELLDKIETERARHYENSKETEGLDIVCPMESTEKSKMDRLTEQLYENNRLLAELDAELQKQKGEINRMDWAMKRLLRLAHNHY